jgi:hypothetical protein
MRPLAFLALAFLAFCFPTSAAPKAANDFQRIDGCTWKFNRWNDGDSFHIITGDAGKEIVARLYFVDAPESETAYRDRIDEQAAYFGITPEQAVEIAHKAADFTQQQLSKPFHRLHPLAFCLGAFCARAGLLHHHHKRRRGFERASCLKRIGKNLRDENGAVGRARF